MYTPRKTELIAAARKIEVFMRYNSVDKPKLANGHKMALGLLDELDEVLHVTPGR